MKNITAPKTKGIKLIFCITILVVIDFIIKVIINNHFLEVRFTITPNLLEFAPTWNNKAPYFIQLLGYRMHYWIQIIMMCFCSGLVTAYYFYKSIIRCIM